MTFRHYKGGKSSAKSTGHLYPKRNPWYSLSEAESTSRHIVLSGVPRKESPVTPPGIDPGTVRLHYPRPPMHPNANVNIIIIIIIIFLHGLVRLTCSGIDALPSFPGASTISSPPRFVIEGVFRKSGVVHSFEMVDPVLFVFRFHVLYSRDL